MKKEVVLFAALLISTAAIRATGQSSPPAGREADGASRSSADEKTRRDAALSVLAALRDPANEEKARRALADDDWYIRGQAALALARAGKATAKDLAPLLDDKNWFVRSSALEALSVLRDPSVGPNVLPLLDPADPEICARAAVLLGRIEFSSATDPLTKLLAADDEQVKRAAVQALGELKAQAVEDSLIELLKDDSLAIKSASVVALGRIGDRKAVPAVEAAFDEAVKREAPDTWEYAAALYRLGNHDHIDLVIGALRSDYPDTRAGALEALTEFGDDRAMPALTGLAHNDGAGSSPGLPLSSAEAGGAPFRLKLVVALSRINDGKARSALEGFFTDPDPEVRAAAVTGLATSIQNEKEKSGSAPELDETMTAMVGLLKSEQSPPVIAALTKSFPMLDRDRAVEALLVQVRYGDNIAKALSGLGVTVEAMSAKLSSGELSDRIYAAGILGRLGDHQAVRALDETLISSKEPSLQVKAAESLGLLADRGGESALIQAGRSDNPEVKAAAIAALGRMGDLSVTDTLFEATRDNRENVREAAFKSLDVLGISVEKLSADAASASWQTRVTAIATFGRLRDPRAVPVVITALDDRDERVRIESAKTLAVLADKRAVEPLIAALKDPDPGVRFEAAAALGVYRDGRSLNPLTALLNDNDARVSAAAAESLARMNDPRATGLLVGYLSNADWRLRARAAQVLMRVPEASARAVGPLVTSLRDRDLVVRYYAAEALVNVGSPAVTQLVDLFRSGTFAERERSARVLARIGQPAALPLSALAQERSTPPELKAASAHMLGLIADPQAVPALVTLLSDDRYFVREQASFALGRIGQPAIDELIDMSGSPAPATRQAAVSALGTACAEIARRARVASGGSPASADPPEVRRSIDTILNSLKDSTVGVRTAAIHALGDAGSPRAVAPLIALLEDESSTMRGEASLALGKLHNLAVPALISELGSGKPSTRKLAAEALGETGSKDAVPALIRLVSTDLSGARAEAIEALGKIGDPSAVDAILSAMATGSAGVKQKAISALVALRDPRVQDALISALTDRDGDSRRAAAIALGDLGDQKTIPILEKIVDHDPDPEVRAAAVSAIERLIARSRQTNDSKQ